jgi:uncharacterized protein (TIGR00304 family)
MSDQLLFNLGAILVFAGFLVVFVAVLLMVLTAARGKGKFEGGAAVIIGPFPIVFGTDRESLKILLLLSMTLIILVVVVTVVFHFVLE